MPQASTETRDTARASTKPEAKPAPQPEAAAEPAAAETGAPQAGGVSEDSKPGTETEAKMAIQLSKLVDQSIDWIGDQKRDIPTIYLVTAGPIKGVQEIYAVRACGPESAVALVRRELSTDETPFTFSAFELNEVHSELAL